MHDTKPLSIKLSDLVGYHLRRASLCDLQGSNSVTQKFGLRPVPMSVLMIIGEQPSITSADICRLLGMQRANIAPILADFDKVGWILREADASDSRLQRLSLSPEGQSLIQAVLHEIHIHEERMLAGFTPEERAQLVGYLSRIWKED